MCGINGLIALNRSTGASVALVRNGMTALAHRGPDDSGIWSDEDCVLGHRRLAIIDLSEAGRQPLSNEDGTIWVTFNGEIYNFQELRRELETYGHKFRTHTDTETIVHAYEQWDTDCLKRLRGMFALGLWDQRRKRLLLARDRVGKKPLYVAQYRGRLAFASEMQGLTCDPELPRDVDPVAVDAYLSWGYVPAPLSIFRSVSKVPPAGFLTATIAGDIIEVKTGQYWDLPYGPKLRLTEPEAREALREKVKEAVRLRLISDVPVGAFLSGGVDSSIVVGMMASLTDRPVKTFSIGFEEAAFNELDHARRIARRWGTEHEEHIVRPDALEVLPVLVRHYGEPYADSSAVPTYYVSKLTSARVKVALNGDGGDESFAGYDRHYAFRLAERIKRLPGLGIAARIGDTCIPNGLSRRSLFGKAKRFLEACAEPRAARYGRWIGQFSDKAKAELYSPEFRVSAATAGIDLMTREFSRVADLDALDAVLAIDVRTYLPGDLLAKVDITAMANSLEARSPLLDHGLMEFAARLPGSMKVHGRTSKYLLKETFADLLPSENVNRLKMGFGVPVGEWFRGPLRELLEDTVCSQRAADRGFFDRSAVRRLVDEHQAGRQDAGGPLWTLLMLELWHREFADAGRVESLMPGRERGLQQVG